MKSILNDAKRDEALERIAIAIAEGSKNCVIVIKKICTICQYPDQYERPTELLEEYLTYLMTRKFHNQVKNWTTLENSFFAYFFSLLPLHFRDEKVKEPSIINAKTYKWTKKDSEELIYKCIEKWFKDKWIVEDWETILHNEYEIKKLMDRYYASLKAKNAIFRKKEKLASVLLPEFLFTEINNIRPSKFKEYQIILFDNLIHHFINALPHMFNRFVDDFYETGGYIHKFFAWNNN